jgi:hypothetical protein
MAKPPIALQLLTCLVSCLHKRPYQSDIDMSYISLGGGADISPEVI